MLEAKSYPQMCNISTKHVVADHIHKQNQSKFNLIVIIRFK